MARDPNLNAVQARALYDVFVIERRHKVDAVAVHMGISPATFYGWIENKATLPAWALRRIYEATKDADLFARLTGAKDCGLRVVSNAPAVAVRPAEVRRLALEVGAESGDVLRAVSEAAEDGVIDDAERERVLRELEELLDRAGKLGEAVGLRVAVAREETR